MSGDTEAFVHARGTHGTLVHAQGSQSRGLPCQVMQSRKVVSECLLWVGPCSQCSACLCELDCVSWCMCLQKAVGLSSLSLPWKAPKSKMGDSPAPPTLTWSSLGQSSKRKVFGGNVGWGRGGDQDNRAGADFAAFPCSAPREYISIPYPTFYPTLDPKLSPLS